MTLLINMNKKPRSREGGAGIFCNLFCEMSRQSFFKLRYQIKFQENISLENAFLENPAHRKSFRFLKEVILFEMFCKNVGWKERSNYLIKFIIATY